MELLVAIAILSIISISCYVAFDTGLKSWRKSEARVERYQNARAALEMMAKDLQGTFISSVNSNIYRLMENAFGIYLTTNAISVTTDINRVGYTWVGSGNSIIRGINPNYVLATPDPASAVGAIDQSSNVLISEGIVTVLSFEYGFYENATNRNNGTMTWKSANSSPSLQWDSNVNNLNYPNFYKNNSGDKNPDGLPEAIRIGLVVQDEKSYEPAQSFYTTVYLPNAE